MRPVLFAILACVLFHGDLRAQKVDRRRVRLPARSADIVHYRMRVRLDPERKFLSGTQMIRYRNRTEGTTRELRFHLYLNAFSGPDSTHLRESAPTARARYESPEEYGWIRFRSLGLAGGEGKGGADLLPGLRFVSPDDGNPKDRTVAVVPLPAPFVPGEEIRIETAFEAKLPKAFRRTGWGPGNFFMAAQWFPKLGVLEDSGEGTSSWNCHQFHAWTEFYADFGTYEVVIEVPEGWPVGATGRETKIEVLGDGYAAHHFRQEDVHDFAWVTDPDYAVHGFLFEGAKHEDPKFRRLYEKALGYDAKECRLTDVRVRLLLHPEHDTPAQRERHRRAVFEALAFFGNRFGRYPYETLTVVDPVFDAKTGRNLGGGMEYPTLITCGTPYILHPRQLAPEGVTIHEFGHQFWYGLSGNNEFEASYLDEGWNSYSEGRCQDLAYAESDPGGLAGDPLHVQRVGFWPVEGRNLNRIRGAGPPGLAALTRFERLPLEKWLPEKWSRALERIGLKGTLLPPAKENPALAYLRELPGLTWLHDLPYRSLYADRAGFLADPDKDPMIRLAWRYFDRSSYRVNSYSKPSTILATLERMMGRDRWWPFLRRFHAQARFAHPTFEDFLALLEEMGGPEIASFAREAATTTKALDYGIRKVERIPDLEGRPQGVEVVVGRFGEIRVPVTIRFVFEGLSGAPVSREVLWEAEKQGSWERWRILPEEEAEKGRLIGVYVDPPRSDLEPSIGPAGIYVLDRNLLNNAWRADPDRSASNRIALRALLWVQSVLSFFGAMG